MEDLNYILRKTSWKGWFLEKPTVQAYCFESIRDFHLNHKYVKTKFHGYSQLIFDFDSELFVRRELIEIEHGRDRILMPFEKVSTSLLEDLDRPYFKISGFSMTYDPQEDWKFRLDLIWQNEQQTRDPPRGKHGNGLPIRKLLVTILQPSQTPA